jgi:PAS domain S-box-containing protein
MVQENREGQKLWVEYHAMALRDADGAVVGYVSVNHDLSERKQAEEASHEEEEMLRLAIQAGQAGVWSWDLTTNDMQWSSEFYRIFGFEPGQVAPSFEAGISRVHPDDRSQVESLVREAIEQGTPIDTIHRLVSAGGPTHWVHGISRAYFDEHGQPVRMAGIAMDVTGQQQAEAQLRESEERFRTSVDTMLDGFAIYSAVRDLASGQIIDFRYEYINEAGCRMNRRAGGDTVGHTLLELLPAHRETGILDEYVQVVETGRPLVRENLVYEDTFGGERLRRVFDHRAVKLGDGFALAWRDVSERQQAEEALRLNEARFRIALQDAPISVATQDRELRYTWAYQPQFGFSPEQMLGKRDDELLAPADVAELVALKQAVLDSGQGVHREIRLHTRQGWKQVVLHAEPVMAASGEVVGVGSAAFDITGQRDLEDTVRQNQTRLEVQRRLTGQREQERLQIARDLHDGPLQDLSLLSVELSSAAQIAKDQHLKAAIQAAIVTLRDQIQELREFTTELRPPLLVRFGLPKAIAAHTKGVQAKNPGLQLHLEVQKETPPLPETTRLALYRIYQEALSNILKHAQATEAWIRFGMDAQAAWLVIQDNGTGFSPPTQWLELARQGHLGLVGMQERAEAVGGSLQIQARPGQGTTLYVTVPISGGLPRPTEGMPG